MADYHFAATGSDSTGTGTTLSPWKTMEHAVLSVPDAGHRLLYAPGAYASPTLSRAFTKPLTIQSEGETLLEGLLKITSAQLITLRGVAGLGQAYRSKSEGIEVHGANMGCRIHGMEVTTGNLGNGNTGEGGAGGYAIAPSFKGAWLKISDCWIHDSWGGIGSGHIPSNLDINRLRYMQVYNSLIERCWGDLITTASIQDAHYYKCILRLAGMGNTNEEPHSDHFQNSGDELRVKIDSCQVYQLLDSTNPNRVPQTIFTAGELGEIADLEVINSLVASNLNVANSTGGMKFTGNEPRARILYNTINCPGFSKGLWLTSTRGVNTDRIVVGNAINGLVAYKEEGGATCAVRDYNAYSNEPASKGAHDIVAADFKFVDSGTTSTYGNFELAAGSPLKEAGETVYAPAVDILGRPRGSKPSIGCYQ